MREAAVPGYRLSKARHSTKILVTLGMLGLLLGLLSAALMTVARTGLAPSSVSAYYRGEYNSNDQEQVLDSEIIASEPRPFAELAEVRHLHLVGGSILLFLLCHLLSVCELSEKLRSTLYIVSFVSFITTFGLPWLIVYVGAIWSNLFGPSIIIFISSLLSLTLIPLWEMWLKDRRLNEQA